MYAVVFGPCSGHVPTLPQVMFRVWVRVGVGVSLTEGVGGDVARNQA